ncbi:unnamed protein product [Gongylonema pulchrum]|uniref:RRM domain-containing protein n=1 Tax=Gongylonema pulchrum TaxID=637853 RepID=A0A183DW42_9BILA|nr:unnamed protein product [Gongylonema pulchrum]
MSAVAERTCYVSNLDEKVTQELLTELFIQAGPLDRVILRENGTTASPHRYALAIFLHEVSVPFACDVMDRIALFGKAISVQPKQGTSQVSWFAFLHTVENSDHSFF